MKTRRFVLAAIVLLLIVALLPVLVGMRVEAWYQQLAEQRAVSRLGFDRGWFESSARWRLQLPDMPAFEVVDEIRHGPLLPSGGVALASIRSRFSSDTPLSSSVIHARTRIALDGDGRVFVRIPKSIPLPGARLGGDADGEIRFDAGFETLDADFHLPSLDLLLAGDRLRLDDTALRIGLQRVADDWLVALHVAADGLRMAQRRYTGLRADIDLKHVDPYLLQTLLSASRQRHANAIVAGLARLQMATRVLPMFLADGPELVLQRLRLRTDQGELSASGRLSVDPAWQRESRSLFKVPAYLLARLDASMPVELARRLLRLGLRLRESGNQGRGVAGEAHAGQRLESLIADGWLLRKGDRLDVHVNLQDGILAVNGKALPLNLLLFGS